jgi:hypothetical protein
MQLKEQRMNTYLVQTVSEMINRSFGSEKNKICFKLRFSNTPKILANEMVNEFFKSIVIYKISFFIRYACFWVSLMVQMASLNSGL